MLSYRYFHLYQITTSQVDIGGFFPGNQLGQPKSLTDRPQTPSFYVAGLTSVLSPRVINDFRFNYTRNSWEWGSAGAPAQLPGLGAAIDSPYLPYETARGNSLSRYWNGQDKVVKDDVSLMHGNHLFQIGGTYTRWFLQHQRNDNGLNMITTPTYVVGTGEGIRQPTTYIPSAVPANQYANWNTLYSQVLGFVPESHVFYPRKGGELLPFGQSIKSESVVNNYNVYFSDTWKMEAVLHVDLRPRMAGADASLRSQRKPAHDRGCQRQFLRLGKTISLSASKPLSPDGVFQPIIGFSTIRNVKGSPKYPFDPVYNVFSPRVSAAWSPSFDGGWLSKLFGRKTTVFRGGYARIFGRINGINIVQVPLQGTGIGQAVACIGASQRRPLSRAPPASIPTTAFRIGVGWHERAAARRRSSARTALLPRHRRQRPARRNLESGLPSSCRRAPISSRSPSSARWLTNPGSNSATSA